MESISAIPTVRSLGRAWARAEEREDAEGMADTVRRASAGDRDALAELYASYAGQVFCCVHRILQDPYEAEDVTQQVFLKLMSVLPRYQRREVPFAAWLMRVARNAALDAERKRRPLRPEEEAPPVDISDKSSTELGRSLLDALDALPATQRRVVILRHVAGLSASEVADCLGKTTGSIHALDQRGRRTLQGDLRNRGSAPVTSRRSRRVPLSRVA